MLSAASRALVWVFAPFRPSRRTLPVRYWRWLWLAVVIRLVVGVPVVAITIAPYLLAQAIVLFCDWMGGQVGNVYVRYYNRDLRMSGWEPEVKRAPALRINPEWANRGKPE